MADTTNANAGDANVTFDADPKLEADAAGGGTNAEVSFDAAPDLGAGGNAGTTDAGGEKRSTTDQLRDQAGKFGNQAADRARALADQGKERATGALDEVAKMFESAALDVDSRLGEQYGQYARSAAQGIAGFSDALRGKEVDDLIEDATAFVRKSPAVAVGIAAGVGFVLARLIKSGIDAVADSSEANSPTPKA